MGAHHSATLNPQVREVMSKMKINKAVDHDLIPAGALKSQPKSYAVFFSTGINFILDTSKIPQMWKKGETTPFHKKGVYPDKRKLQASDNTSLAILSFQDTHSQSSQPLI